MSSGVQLQAVTNSGEKVAIRATPDGYIYTTAVATATGVFTSIAESLLIDEAGQYWLIRDNGISFTYINLNTLLAGTPSGKTVPANTDTSQELIEIFYDATASGPSYSAGDILVGITLVDKVDSSIASSFWVNISTNTIISKPANGTYVRHDATQKISSVDIGATTDSVATTDTGSFSLISLFKRLLTNTTTLLTRVPVLGQALSANSVPVVLPATQVTALTPPTTVGVNNFPATQAVIGSVSVSNLPATQPVSGSVSVSNFPATQPVSGAITANAGTNLNTSALALETGGNLASINTKTPALGQALAAGSVPVVLPAAQVTALTPPTSVSVSNLPVTQQITGTVSLNNFPATQPVSGTVTVNAGTNLNTSALALESGGNLASINTKTPALGQALAAGSVPVVLPAAQVTSLTPPTSVGVNNFPATQAVSGTVTVNAGTNLNTSALALEGGGNLASINNKTPALGQALAAASSPVVLPATQITALTPPTSVGINNFPATQAVSGTVTVNAGTNLNTSALALETGGNLASINTKTPALGQALAAGSVPVVLPAAQITALTPPSLITTVASNPSGIVSGKKVVSTAAQALPDNFLMNGVVITASPSNTGTVYIGPGTVTTANGYPLAPGQSIAYGVTTTLYIFVVGTNTTDFITYTGN